LNFFPLPQGQGSLRPALGDAFTTGRVGSGFPVAKYQVPPVFLNDDSSW
jgi:hypothetical protein